MIPSGVRFLHLVVFHSATFHFDRLGVGKLARRNLVLKEPVDLGRRAVLRLRQPEVGPEEDDKTATGPEETSFASPCRSAPERRIEHAVTAFATRCRHSQFQAVTLTW